MPFQRALSMSKANLASIIAGLPVVFWFRDSFISFCRIRGSSMEPTLSDGDIILVRKSDGLLWDYILKQQKEEESVERKLERDKLEEFEQVRCSASPSYSFLKKPPTPISNDIVVFKDPETYDASKWNIKRVVGLGDQIVMSPANRFGETTFRMDDQMTSMRIASRCVPPYSLWVEGDNTSNSYDSRNKKHGAVSKKLLVGIAEYRIWPPTRIGKVNDIKPPEPRPQSYWPS